MLYTDLTH